MFQTTLPVSRPDTTGSCPAGPPPSTDPAGLSRQVGYLELERLRWNGAPDRCPHCGFAGRCQLLRQHAGGDRRRAGSSSSSRRAWRCAQCRQQFSVLTGTVLQGSRVAPQCWLAVAGELARPRPGAAGRLSRAQGIQVETAERLLRRLRAACELAELSPTADQHRLLTLLLRLPTATVELARIAAPLSRDGKPTRGPYRDYH